MGEKKHDRFRKAAEKRANQIMEDMEKLGNCSAKASYDYTDAEAEQIIEALEQAVHDLRERFAGKRVFQKDWKTSGVPFYRAREIVKLFEQGFADNELCFSWFQLLRNIWTKITTPIVGHRRASACRCSTIERVKKLNKANWDAEEGLYEQVESIRLEELPIFLRDHMEDLLTGPRPFAEYVRAKFREKGVLQQNIFLAADISENYGYKLIAEEKHTVQRDIILRICLAAQFDLNETQKALILYGMAPLYWLLPRDLMFMAVIVHKAFDIHQVNEILIRCALAPLVTENG